MGMVILPLLFSLSTAWAEGRKVTKIQDGDTFDVRAPKKRVRILGVDAPELKQPFGTQARDALEARLSEKTVTLNTFGHDNYGRVLAQVLLPDGVDLGLKQVRDGWAWVYGSGLRALPKKQRKAYREAQSLARKEQRGLWVQKNPVAPWKFRKRVRD
jgi:micrococcal nuclease